MRHAMMRNTQHQNPTDKMHDVLFGIYKYSNKPGSHFSFLIHVPGWDLELKLFKMNDTEIKTRLRLFDSCILAAPIVYILLTITAILSLASPFLTQLASHGKTRTIIISHKDGVHERKSCLQPARVKDKARNASSQMPASFLSFLDHPRLQVSKRHFVHFYTIGLLWSGFIFMHAYDNSSKNLSTSTSMITNQSMNMNINRVRVLLFVHLTRRLYECRYVHRWRGTMHIAGFVLGLLHYILLPFIFIPTPKSSSFPGPNTLNHIELVDNAPTPMYVIYTGIILNLYAQYQQHVHHRILSTCRKIPKSSSTPSQPQSQHQSSYSIPHGKWFEWVSCPHYLAEIMIYLSLTILLHSSIHSYSYSHIAGYEHSGIMVPAVNLVGYYKHILLVAWVAINLSVSARSCHEWYQKQFVDYPKLRTALVPFLW